MCCPISALQLAVHEYPLLLAACRRERGHGLSDHSPTPRRDVIPVDAPERGGAKRGAENGQG